MATALGGDGGDGMTAASAGDAGGAEVRAGGGDARGEGGGGPVAACAAQGEERWKWYIPAFSIHG